MKVDEICMVVPNYSNKRIAERKNRHLLLLQNTGRRFECDYEDWVKAKHCLWWYSEELQSPINASNITFAHYVGIKGKRLIGQVEKYNF